ncbi:MAG: 50S ribosomal protein L25/general stress protein Ctc [Alphaproteobacteria bacterium]|nr:50S ribosomal protein L25/general stress protein Ctc [Alphaproteobacteria bacterium]
MSAAIELQAVEKPRSGKGIARALRRNGYLPCVIYGGGKDPVSMGVDPATIEQQLRNNTLFTVIYDITTGSKKKEHVLARDLQVDPVTDELLHLDFLRITDTTRINVPVPIHFENEDQCPGLKTGGILQLIRSSAELSCRAASIPEYIVVDLSKFNVGDSVRISDIDLPDGVTPTITDRNFMIAGIQAPKIAAETDDNASEAEVEKTTDES